MQTRKWLDPTFIGQTAVCTIHLGHFFIFFPISSVVSGEWPCKSLAKARSEFFSARMSPKDMWKNLRAYAISSNTTKDRDVGLDTETADRFNTYFAGVGQRIAAELAEQPVGSVPPRPPIVISAGFRVRPVTISELGDALRRMSNSAAVGCDGVSLKIVRRCFAVLAPHILFMINMSIVSGVVPPEWKQAIVVPIHKSGDKTLPCNFRPVSVLSVIGKLAEKSCKFAAGRLFKC